ncbi:MAG: winged helix-turn-helix transcriptional regulator [Candidatus Kariarchaeaceae archaeon]
MRNPILNKNRLIVYEQVANHPGIKLGDIAEEIGIARPTVEHHVKKLQEIKLVGEFHISGSPHYFAANLRTEEIERALILLRNPKALFVFKFIKSHGPITMASLSSETELPRDTIMYHLDKLLEMGLISKDKRHSDQQERKAIHYLSSDFFASLLPLNPQLEEYIKFFAGVLTDHHIQYFSNELKDETLILRFSEQQLSENYTVEIKTNVSLDPLV